MSRENQPQIRLLKQPPLFCSNCRTPESLCIGGPLIKCTRCQLKRYCCSQCEQNDLGMHQEYCTNLERMRKLYETYPSHPLGVRSHQMGSLVFHVAYRTMDTTFAHEASLFSESLRYYMEAYQMYSQAGRTVYYLEDQMLVLYAALGHNEVAFEEIYSFLKVPQNVATTTTAKMPHINDDMLMHLPDAPWRLSLLAVLLLLKMRLVARLRQREREFRAYRRTTGGRVLEQVDSVLRKFLVGETLENQEKQLQRLVQRIPYDLRRTICTARPLTQWDAPGLLHYMVPPECWQILQDCFTSDPGIGPLMREYMLVVDDTEQQMEAMIFDVME